MINKDITILIVEDDEQIRNFLCYALKQQGFLTETAGTGEKALAALAGKKNKPPVTRSGHAGYGWYGNY